MVGKKVSGQTVAIIILAVLLLITIAFGGVFAFYSARTNKMKGVVVMANLSIELATNEYGTTDKSAKSEIVISHGTNFVPGQELKNSSLMVINKSRAPIYVVVVYEISANRLDEKGENVTSEIIEDTKKEPLLEMGAEYVNTLENINYEATTNQEWVDYVFRYTVEEETKVYRCFVSTLSYEKSSYEEEQEITVIGENKLKLHRYMGNEYKNTSLTFTFQAYAISANSFTFADDVTQEARCNEIVSAIYKSVDYKFFDGTVNIPGEEQA